MENRELKNGDITQLARLAPVGAPALIE